LPPPAFALKVLILKPSSLGDVVQALPVLRLLKLHRPDSQVYWWLDASLLPLLEGDPDLAGLFTFHRRRWASPLRWPEALASIRQMRALRCDWVIDLQSLARSGLFAWLANGEITIGLDDAREGARGFHDLVVPRASFQTHAVDWYLGVLRVLGVPVHRDFTWLPPRRQAAERVHQQWLVPGARWIVLQPGARWLNKRWPVEHFADLVRRLASDFADLRFVILGGAADVLLGATLTQAVPGRCLDLTGRSSLPEMVEIIRAAVLMVTNDTGPMHVAAALGKPVVAVFGPTEPRRTGPYGQVERALQTPELPCVPCLKEHCAFAKPMECLRALTPARVYHEVVRRLDEATRPSRGLSGEPTASGG
jgi:lipopolysaccharide heptosyltransferase II